MCPLHFSLNRKMFWISLGVTPLPPMPAHKKRVLFWVSVGSLRFQKGHQLREAKGSSTIDFINLAFPQPSHELALYEPAFQNPSAVKEAWPNTQLNSAWAKSQSSLRQQESPLFLSSCKNTDHPVNPGEREREAESEGKLRKILVGLYYRPSYDTCRCVCYLSHLTCWAACFVPGSY